MRSLCLAVVIVMGLAAFAHAGDTTTLFPLSAVLPKTLKAAPAELTRVLAKDLSADVANVPIEDAAELIECELTARACLTSIARSVGATTIAFGRIERRGDGLAITLTTYEPGRDEHHERRIAIVGDNVDALVASLTARLAPPEDERPKKLAAKLRPAILDDVVDAPLAQPASGITTGTWSVIIAGGVTFAAGAGFLVSANNLRGEARRAPTETLADIERLAAIEKAGRLRVQIGGALMAAGGVVATIGIVRAVIQRKSTSERPLVDVVPTAGGASVFFTKEWK